MSREIKFRGKIKYNGNHYFSGNWVYGYFFKDDNGDSYIIDRDEDELGNARFSPVEVIPESVGQFTGLKDKNGLDIYEGDILKSKDGAICKIEYRSSTFYCVYESVIVNADGQGEAHQAEIIGNIHENPELLENRGTGTTINWSK